MRCAERHSCDRFSHFPYENLVSATYKHEPATLDAKICDAVGMSSFRDSRSIG
jgi:hypothetical protein